MSWNGILRDLARANRQAARAHATAVRRVERDVAQRRRALLAEQQRYAVYAEAQRAAHEVELFENYLELIVSAHREASTPWDWAAIARCEAPRLTHEREAAAHHERNAYVPSLVDRALGKDKVRWAELEAAVMRARQEDYAFHQQRFAEWEWHARIASGVNAGDLQAFQAVIEHLSPLEELEDLGTHIEFSSRAPWYLEARVAVRSADIVPKEEIKLSSAGKISKKAMASGKYWALYQDHVCSAAIRVARELFALLPIKVVFVHTSTETLNTATGHKENVPIVSVAFERERFLRLNFASLDASDAVTAFGGVMKFKKTAGFSPIDVLEPGTWVSTS